MNNKKEIVDLVLDQTNNKIFRRDEQLFLKTTENNLNGDFKLSTSGILGSNDLNAKIKDLYVLNSQKHLKQIKEYHDDFDKKLTFLYENISNDLVKKHKNINNKNSNVLVNENEVLLNKHTIQTEKICNQIALEWKEDLILDIVAKQDAELDKEQARFEKEWNKKLAHYNSRLEKAKLNNSTNEVMFEGNEIVLAEKLKRRNEEEIESIYERYEDIKLDAIAKLDEDILKDKKYFEVNEYDNWDNFSFLASFISKEIGIINQLEELLNEQELIRSENYVKRAEVNRLFLNGFYKSDLDYETALYNTRVKFMYGLGAEVSILKYLVYHHELLFKLRQQLKQTNHPLQSYALYIEILDKIKLITQLNTKAESLKSETAWGNEASDLVDLIGDPLNQTKQQVIYKETKIINNKVVERTVIDPQYEIEIKTNDAQSVNVSAYIGSQKLDTKTTIKENKEDK